jgi:aryl-alcohol dehydrogenase-like predicted oxidoreductase
MGVIIKEALANGRLSGRNRREEDADDLKVLKQEALKLNTSIDSLALAVTLAQPFVDVVLSGASTSEQVRSNLTAINLKLDGSIPSEFKNFAKPAELYWEQRKRLEWN